MKKLMFTFAAIAVAFTSANAQKQLGGEHNIEVSFNPVSSLLSQSSLIDASTIKYRKFMDDDRALRVSLSLDNSTNKYLVVPENTLGSSADERETHDDLYLTNANSGWSLGLGYEMHFGGTDNLSPYFAVAAGYGSNSLVLERDHFSALNLLAGTADQAVWEAETNSALWGIWSYKNEIKSTTLNLDLLFGADYYFNDAIYVGFEAGLRLSQTSGISSTITASNPDAFNIYFDGGIGNDSDSEFVSNTSESGFQWSTNQPVNYVINGEPWNSTEFAEVYMAVDDLWSTWDEQSPANFDEVTDSARDAYYNGTNFLGTYSTGMLRIGFLFE